MDPFTLADIRPAAAPDLPALSALCLRSKAHWGYDAAFIAACRDELTLTEADLSAAETGALWSQAGPVAVAQVALAGQGAELTLLYVDPPRIGRGLGRLMLRWAAGRARAGDARALRIEADPQAGPFYRAMGAIRAGDAPSGSIPGRSLPVYRLTL